MAHCNLTDDSFHELPPLRSISRIQKITDPIVSPRGYIHLGAFTAPQMAVCMYAGRMRPALVAYDYSDGSVLWTSSSEDLRGFPERVPAGILMARLTVRSKPARRYVFAANPFEIVAYTAAGNRVWRRPAREIAPQAPLGIGAPISISYTAAGELVTATTHGWVVKLDPIDGTVVDAYQMKAHVFVDGKLYRGTFVTFKSPVVIGDVLYLLVEFKPNSESPLPPNLRPVHIVRLRLSGSAAAASDRRIRPIYSPKGPKDVCPDRVQIGVDKGRGSPPAMRQSDGSTLVFGTASELINGRLVAVMTGVEDRDGTLGIRWRCVMDAAPGDRVHSAPALHAGSRTLFVCTRWRMFLFGGVDSLEGNVPSPAPIRPRNLLALPGGSLSLRIAYGSPFALAYDQESSEIVAYTNFIVLRSPVRPFGFLGAFGVPVARRGKARPLWSHPLATTPAGTPAPGLGTFGQPALFQFGGTRGTGTGLIVNTVSTGTYIFR